MKGIKDNQFNYRRYIQVCFIAIGLCSCRASDNVVLSESGKVRWPEVTMEAKPWTRWWWFGSAVTEKDITAALEAYREAGLGGVEITPVYGVRGMEERFLEYLSQEWMEKLVYTLAEAKRLGLGVDMANASGWPFGGPWVGEETACKSMLSKTFRLKEGQKLSGRLEYIRDPLAYTQSGLKVSAGEVKEPITANDNLQENCYAQVWYKKSLPLVVVTASRAKEDGKGFAETIDLTGKVKDGVLDWTAPQGEWLLCALFQGEHGKMVERAAPGGEGNVIDHFSERAVTDYLKRFDEAFSGYDLRNLRCYFNDSYEVDDAVGSANWTPKLLAEFQRICGYDLREYLPALLGMAEEDMNRRVLHDYRMVISELMLTRFTQQWQSWARRQGKAIRNQAHGSPANALDLYAASDIPETEGGTITDIKSASSVSHVTGKKLTSAESATLLNEHFLSKLSDVKTANDKFLLGGVNHLFYHGTAFSPQDAPWPGWLFYAAVHLTPANSFWEDFGSLNRYMARSQSFLQVGKPANDLLLYYGIADLWSEPTEGLFHYFHSFKTVSMDECGRYLWTNGYSWDAVSDRMLQQVRMEKGKLVAGGNVYKALMVPRMKHMSVATFEHLMKLAEEGATIAFYGELPADVPGLIELERNRNRLASLKGKLRFATEGNVQIATYGKGRFILSMDLPGLTNQLDIAPESICKQGLQYVRRLKEDRNYYYFILNPGKQPFASWINLNADYQSCALYNPMTGKEGYARVRDNKAKTEVWLELKPNESMIVETFRRKRESNEKDGACLYSYYKPVGDPVDLNTEWQITFVKGGPQLPASKRVFELHSWTEYGEEYAAFSGTAEYTASISLPSGKVDAWRLHMEHVHESATVSVNGCYLGTLLENPYTIEIPASVLKKDGERNELTIRVSNLMANRIAYMDKNGIKWRNFYNANFESKGRMNIGQDGKFSAAHWMPLPSGVFGRVTLTPLSLVTD